MNFKSIALVAATVSMLSGAAIAQDATDTDTKTNSTTGSTALDQEQREMRAPFYTDDSMTTLRSGDEFTSAWNAMSATDQERIRQECANSTSPEDEFCRSIENISTQ